MPRMKLVFLFLFTLSAQAQDLATSSEWLNLLHMRKTLTGRYESKVRGEGFFLNPKGSKDPQAEYQTTEQAMFGDNQEIAKKVQCQFLARRDFFIRHGKAEYKTKILPCEFSDEWLQKLNASRITLVFAAAYLNSASSSFGHTFLKLQNAENDKGRDLLNYGINFAARTADIKDALYALYGLTGIFPGTFAMQPYHQMIKDYTHLEGRDLWEYELDLTSEEVRRILYHLLELDKVYFDYYFLDDNCSYALLKLLEIGRPGLELVDDEELFVIPLDTVKVVMPIVKAKHYRPSLETDWNKRRENLTDRQSSDLKKLIKNPTAESIQALDTQTLTTAQYLATLKSFENHHIWKPVLFNLNKERAKRRQDKADFEVPTPKDSPDEGPHSSAITLGYLDHKQKSMLFGFSAAFHDQLSRNVGVSPYSHLEVFGFQWSTGTLEQIHLRRYRLLEMLSTASINDFDRPLSWGASIGGDHDPIHPSRTRSHLLGKAGWSFDLYPERMRWTVLGVIGSRQDLDQNFQLTPGIDSRLWVIWLPRVRSLVQYETFKFPSTRQSSLRFGQAFDLTSQLELRLGWQGFEENGETFTEKSVSLWQNFLF